MKASAVRFGVAVVVALSLCPPCHGAVATVVNSPGHMNPAANLARIHLPPGFRISLYTDQVPGAREMAVDRNGTVFVGTIEQGKVYAVVDDNGDGKADRVFVIADHLNHPNGVAVRDGNLYVAEISRILRFDNIESHLSNPPAPVVVYNGYPSKLHHGNKFIRFGPDGKLYVPVGAPCNICEPKDPYGTITRINPDGSHMEIFARGIRDCVGFDWDPATGDLWFTDNGRDLMGDNRPPEELNHAPGPGLNFGYPYRYGKGLVDPTFKTSRKASSFQPAALEMPAHSAPLGMRFYTGRSFPRRYRHAVFIAQHGSWNRSVPIGYQVVVARIADNKVVDYRVFASGWLVHGRYWGRPVDVQVLKDGSLLVSDDYAGCIYRITYQGGD